MPNPKFSPAEEVMFEFGAIKVPAALRHTILGCLGCRWATADSACDTPKAYRSDILRCTQLPNNSIDNSFASLEGMGAIVLGTDADTAAAVGNSLRSTLHASPADTALGRAVALAMEPPKNCGLPQA